MMFIIGLIISVLVFILRTVVFSIIFYAVLEFMIPIASKVYEHIFE